MTNESISLIGVRVLAFFFLGQAIVELPNIYFMLAVLPYADTSNGIRTEQIVLACSTVAAPFLVGVVMHVEGATPCGGADRSVLGRAPAETRTDPAWLRRYGPAVAA